jgi:hypothetical protein
MLRLYKSPVYNYVIPFFSSIGWWALAITVCFLTVCFSFRLYALSFQLIPGLQKIPAQ